ncbi:MAG: hypothetical protein REH83_01715 [Rickettsiella sp.]|nr:hypothetical protein [Rickettsiella sp.]
MQIKSYANGGMETTTKIAMESAKVHNYPADIINCVLEELIKKRYELRAFSHIDRFVKQRRYRANQQIFNQVHRLLSDKTKHKFDKLTANATCTAYNKLKELPKSTSISHFKGLLTHHIWLESFGSTDLSLLTILLAFWVTS